MSLQDAKDRVKAELEERLKAQAGAARVYDDPKDARAEAAYIANGRLARQAAADHGAPTLLVQSDNNDLSVVEATTLDRAVFHAEVESELVSLLLPHVDHVPIPSEWKARWCTSFVEHTILAIIDVDRLTDAMEYVISKQREEHLYSGDNRLLRGRTT